MGNYFLCSPLLDCSHIERQQIRRFDGDLSKAISSISTTMSAVQEHAKETEEHIHITIEKLISLLRDREAALISAVEAARHQKGKELLLQRESLEFLLGGIRYSASVAEALRATGTESEVAAGYQQVATRMATLTAEREKAQLEPVTEATIEFFGAEKGEQVFGQLIADLGAVITRDFSPEQSTVQIPEADLLLNQPCTFKVTLVDKRGQPFIGKGEPFDVEFEGPEKLRVTILRFMSLTFLQDVLTILPSSAPSLQGRRTGLFCCVHSCANWTL